MAMKNTDHVVFDSAAAGGHCLHCDTREPAYKLPMSIPDFLERSTKFIEAHKDCVAPLRSSAQVFLTELDFQCRHYVSNNSATFYKSAVSIAKGYDELLDTMRCFASGQYDESEVQDMAKASIAKVGAA